MSDIDVIEIYINNSKDKDSSYFPPLVGWADIAYAGLFLSNIAIHKDSSGEFSFRYPRSGDEEWALQDEPVFRPMDKETESLIEQAVISEYEKSLNKEHNGAK